MHAQDLPLFQAALGLSEPWQVTSVEFDAEAKRFEALVMAMVREMPVATLAGLVGESDMRVWRVVHHYVDLAVETQNLEGVERVGIDETSSRRGHDYVSVFADLDKRRGVFVVEGRDHETVQAFSCFLEMQSGDPELVQEVCQECPRRS